MYIQQQQQQQQQQQHTIGWGPLIYGESPVEFGPKAAAVTASGFAAGRAVRRGASMTSAAPHAPGGAAAASFAAAAALERERDTPGALLLWRRAAPLILQQ